MTERIWTFPYLVYLTLASAVLLSGITVSTARSETVPSLAWRDDYKRPTSIPYPKSNPFSEAKAALGRLLFFDVRFSASQTHSCGSCHDPARSWSDGLAKARGEGATAMPLRSPTLIDIAWLERLGWDGKFRDIEAVTFGPILAQSNMNMTEATLLDRLKAVPTYVAMFAEAFPNKAIDRRNIEQALATYQRSIVSGVAPFDRWIEGDDAAIGPAAKRGFALFNGKAKCAECHSGWAFTDGSFHDIGVAKPEELGRGRFFPTSVKLKSAFKTPTLRDVAHRSPYMHDGTVASLADVIDLYDRGGVERASRAEAIKPLHLGPDEKADLIAFLQTLSEAEKPIALSRAP